MSLIKWPFFKMKAIMVIETCQESSSSSSQFGIRQQSPSASKTLGKDLSIFFNQPRFSKKELIQKKISDFCSSLSFCQTVFIIFLEWFPKSNQSTSLKPSSLTYSKNFYPKFFSKKNCKMLDPGTILNYGGKWGY